MKNSNIKNNDIQLIKKPNGFRRAINTSAAQGMKVNTSATMKSSDRNMGASSSMAIRMTAIRNRAERITLSAKVICNVQITGGRAALFIFTSIV